MNYKVAIYSSNYNSVMEAQKAELTSDRCGITYVECQSEQEAIEKQSIIEHVNDLAGIHIHTSVINEYTKLTLENLSGMSDACDLYIADDTEPEEKTLICAHVPTDETLTSIHYYVTKTISALGYTGSYIVLCKINGEFFDLDYAVYGME